MRSEIVVNTLIHKSILEKQPLTHLKIQKLLYFLHGHYLASHKELLLDEQFKAWQYGPVIPEVYEKLKHYGSNPVTRFLPIIDRQTMEEKYFVANDQDLKFFEIFNLVWNKYSKFSALELSNLSHKKNSPWDLTSDLMGVIHNDLIYKYFSENSFYDESNTVN